MSLTPADFVHRWKINANSERAGAHSHFNDLCDMLGQPHPADIDPAGDRYAFEKAVPRTSGGKGFADVWLRDHFAWEYKAKHKDLKAAYRQLNDYREALLNPPLLVVCDFDRFEIHTNFANTSKRVYAFTLDDLARNQVTASCPLPPLEVLRALFGDTSLLRPDRTDAFVTQEAAKLFARLAERLELEKRLAPETSTLRQATLQQANKEQIAHFLMRILFCLFADSIGLLPDRVFRRLIEIDRFYPRRFLLKLEILFQAMRQRDGIFGEHTIPWFNGGLFDDNAVIPLDKADMGILYDVAHKYDWAHIAPAIFGTLFERSLDPARRSLIGAHYTSEEDILLLIEPVVMRPLEQRWQQVRDNILATLAPTPPQNVVILSEAQNLRISPLPLPVPSPPKPGTKSKALKSRPTPPPGEAPGADSALKARSIPAWGEAPGANPDEGPRAESPTYTTADPTPSPSPVSPATQKRAAKTRPPDIATFTNPTTLLASNPQAERQLAAWFDELAAIRILDPACGSGNFLYVALRRLLDLWKQARDFALEHNIQLALQYAVEKMVSPSQLFGIEIEFYAHELASIVVWIGFLQWKHEHGINEDREPILQKLNNIEHADAILRYDKDNKPYEPEWPKADFIIGNPPFLGGKLLRRELGDEYVDAVFKLYRGRVKAESDLVIYWFEKARQYIEDVPTVRVGLLATQAIRGGANRNVLERIQASGNIFWAWSDRPWLLKGAAVHVSMIGFDNGSEKTLLLDDATVVAINANLTTQTDVTVAKRLPENRHICYMGSSKGGAFDIDAVTARNLLTSPVNPNGRPNSDVVRPWINSLDITRRPRGMYIIDFPADISESEAALYELPFDYIRQHVAPKRELNRRAVYAENWWIHAESRPELRKMTKGRSRFIATTRVSAYRVFIWVPAGTLPDSATFAFAREDDYFFGVLHSKVHQRWSLAQGTQLEDRPRYTPDSTFDTFPFPWPPGTEPSEAESPQVRAIAEAARTLVDLRDKWLNPPGSEADLDILKDRTLTKLYNLRAAGKCAWLENAHRTLDQAVFSAYAWPSNLTTQEILARLLALNHQRAGIQPAS